MTRKINNLKEATKREKTLPQGSSKEKTEVNLSASKLH